MNHRKRLARSRCRTSRPALLQYRHFNLYLAAHQPQGVPSQGQGAAHRRPPFLREDAQEYGQQSTQLAQQIDSIDTFALCEVFFARLKFAQGDLADATARLAKAEQFLRQRNFEHRMPEIIATQVFILLHQGNLAVAADLAEKHDLPISQARVLLARGEASAALAVLRPLGKQAEIKGEVDKYLKIIILQAVAYHACDKTDEAIQLLGEAMELAEPSGFIRIFVDEGLPMAQLLSEAIARGIMLDYARKLLAAFEVSEPPPSQELVEPLSKRELEILTLIATGLKNKEIAEQLVISLNTVLYHTKNIYRKLDVNKRTLATAKAKEINLI